MLANKVLIAIGALPEFSDGAGEPNDHFFSCFTLTTHVGRKYIYSWPRVIGGLSPVMSLGLVAVGKISIGVRNACKSLPQTEVR